MRAPAVWRRISERAEGRLTSHFFAAMFDFGILTPAGADSFVHLSLGAIGALLALGLRFALVYAGKYRHCLRRNPRNRIASHCLVTICSLIALIMLLIALMTLLVSQSLFFQMSATSGFSGHCPFGGSSFFARSLPHCFCSWECLPPSCTFSLMPLILSMSVSRFSGDRC